MKAVLHNPAIQGTKARLTVNYGLAAHWAVLRLFLNNKENWEAAT